MMFMNDALFA